MTELDDISNKDRNPQVGPFYFYKGSIIAPESFQREVDLVTLTRGEISICGFAGEHRDVWENYMAIQYPELISSHNDDHKALPRGRVDYEAKSGRLRFWVTLDKCIVNQETEIIRIYRLEGFEAEFHYGSMNYQCRDCKDRCK